MSTARRVFGYSFSLAMLAGLLLVLWQRQAIIDWWRLRSYTPPPAVVALAANTTMTEESKHVFYVNHPKLIADKVQFRQNCPLSEQTIVLGCYRSGNTGIYVYDVEDDSQLNGVEQVTAAHEMLHAVYERLSSSEREHVNQLLSAYYQNGLTDERIKKSVDSYRQSEPNELINEMHSIFGTEIRTLPTELENYYRRYFSDRTKVVAYAEAYEAVFEANQQQLQSIKNEIDELKAQLANEQSVILAEQQSLEGERSRMDSLLASGQVGEYNAAVGPYNSRVQRLRSQITSYNAKVEKINDLIEQYNELAVAQENLINSIDNRLQPQPKQ